MISEAILRDKVGERLYGAKSVAPGVVRAERSRPLGQPFAIYYFALSKSLQEWAERLEELQDEVLGPGYYESGGHLRWNQYLYLLAPEEERKAAKFDDWKRAIERNRSYARKFVLTEGQLDQVLKMLDPPAEASQSVPSKDVVARWTEHLVEKNLGVVLDQLTLADTVRAIAEAREQGEPQRAPSVQTPRSAHPLSKSFLSSLHIKSFREWPGLKEFDNFGTVNLIVGSNGVGKTSFLEAIEYLYCQENVRTDSVPAKAEVRGLLRGSKEWVVTKNPAHAAEGKQRNLDWYGQRDLRGSTLANSFARFNFLATDDAALQGQKSAKVSFEDMLARIVAGPQASELWDHICRLQPLLSTELARSRELKAAAVDKQNALQVTVDTLRRKVDPSAAIVPTLIQDFARIGWRTPLPSDFDDAALVSELGRAASILNELLHPALADVGDNALDIGNSLAVRLALSDELEPRVAAVASSEFARRAIDAELAGINADIAVLRQIRAAMDAGALQTRELLSRIRIDLRSRRRALDPFVEVLTVAQTFSSSRNLDVELESCESELARLIVQIEDAEKELVVRRRQQSEISSLLAEIRSGAERLLEVSPDHTNCPVCTASYAPEELRRRLTLAMSILGEDSTASLLTDLSERRSRQGHIEDRLKWLKKLASYVMTMGLSSSQSTEAIVNQVIADRDKVEELGKQEAASAETMSRLAVAGFDDITLDRASAYAAKLQVSTSDLVEIDRKLAEFERAAEDGRQKVAALVDSIGAACDEIRRLSGDAADSRVEDLVQAARVKVAAASRASALLSELRQFIDLAESASLADCRSAIRSALQTAEEIGRMRRETRESASALRANEESLTTAKRDVDRWDLRASRFEVASEAVDSIIRSESLIDATDQELATAQAEINLVFRQIHAPQEFSFRRDAQAPLIRDVTGAVATLRDMSTGQRAALVMSIFLAMNGRLQTAPPIMLLDDPVAHIDDFNALSFLDHLRDIAIGGRRQIFYATADTRMASLFEHKLAFLGDEFRGFELSR